MEARLHEGRDIIAPIALPRTSMGEDDLDRGWGPLMRPSRLRPRREGVPFRGVTRLPVAAPKGEMEPSGGTAESHSLRGGEGARPRRDNSKSPECKSNSPPHWGGRETHSGLWG